MPSRGNCAHPHALLAVGFERSVLGWACLLDQLFGRERGRLQKLDEPAFLCFDGPDSIRELGCDLRWHEHNPVAVGMEKVAGMDGEPSDSNSNTDLHYSDVGV